MFLRDLFIEWIYANEPWMPSDPGPDDVSDDDDEPPFGLLQFTVLVLNALLDLDSNKTPGPHSVPPFALPFCLLLNRSLESFVFPDRIAHILKSGKRNTVSNYRGIAILSTGSKLFELLVYKHMHEDLKGQLADCQHGFVKGRSTVSNLLEYSSLVLSIEG
jgi:hypothetical protein